MIGVLLFKSKHNKLEQEGERGKGKEFYRNERKNSPKLLFLCVLCDSSAVCFSLILRSFVLGVVSTLVLQGSAEALTTSLFYVFV